MPRQNRRPPLRLTRFNYWRFSGIAPQAAEELPLDISAVLPDEDERRKETREAFKFSPKWVRTEAHRSSREQFVAHLRGAPCGVVGCRLDAKLEATPDDDRARLALLRYLDTDRLWQQDADAQAVLKALPPAARTTIEARHAEIERRLRRGRWSPLLQRIARDQCLFEEVLDKRASGKLGEIGRRYRLSDSATREVYSAYSAQRQYLLGNITSRIVQNALAKRGIHSRRLDRPVIPRVDDETGSPLPDATRDAIAMHWFAHALRNLRRYRDGNPPLPWSSNCAPTCLAERDRLFRQP